ncbi:hypothetical protein [Muricoccus pecuniae]|uniref:Uncharacterized protein n=1 Tax=Muricoccus pecuniae TaxID=693023 RepID=A0A840YHE5_9PROT|nr:hypothetical protein [Roseomonas pecuniae]MBB5693373.1 hypothetical protein [Roseomonas pecuniae]
MLANHPRTRDAAHLDEGPFLLDEGAPLGLSSARLPPSRPIAHAEEGEGGRSEWWALAKAVLIGSAAVMLIGWVISG